MKGILEFNLPEEQEEHELAVNAYKLVSAISDLDNHCRSALKHGHNYKTPEEVLEAVREQLSEASWIING